MTSSPCIKLTQTLARLIQRKVARARPIYRWIGRGLFVPTFNPRLLAPGVVAGVPALPFSEPVLRG